MSPDVPTDHRQSLDSVVVLPQTLSPERDARVRDTFRARPGRFDTLAVAVLTTAVSLAGASRPSLWYDEAATISASANRSLGDLWHMLGRIDVVHGLFYLIMHGWFTVVPATEFWSRVPSGLAVGVAAAGVVVLAKQFSSRSIAVCSGVMFAILPRTTWAGIEARSYALSAVAAVWLTILLIATVKRNRPWQWVLYAVLFALSVLLNVYLVFVVLVYGAVLRFLAPRRSAVVWWAATSSAVVLAVTPLLAFAHGQRWQVAWIFPVGMRTFDDVAEQQYFDKSTPFAIAAGVAMLAAALLLRRTPSRRPDNGTRTLVTIALIWIVVPTAVLITYSALVEPLYYPRYLYFTAPAMAVLLGFCIVTIARTPLPIVGVVLAFTAAAVPNYVVHQRGPYAKEGMDSSQIADLLTYHAARGDCLLLDNTITWTPGPVRAITATRPSAYGKLRDLGRGIPAAQAHFLWDGHIAVWAISDKIKTCHVIWTVTDRDKALPDHDSGAALTPGPRMARAPVYQVAHGLRFHIVERWQFSFAQVTRSTR